MNESEDASRESESEGDQWVLDCHLDNLRFILGHFNRARKYFKEGHPTRAMLEMEEGRQKFRDMIYHLEENQ